MAFVIIGALGFIWMGFWVFMYDKPQKSRHGHSSSANSSQTAFGGSSFSGPLLIFQTSSATSLHQEWVWP